MIILGVDPGYKRMGYGLIDVTDNSTRYIYWEHLVLSDATLSARLQIIFAHTQKLICKYRPQALAIEEIFLMHNPAIAIKLAHARAAVMVAATDADLTVAEYSARTIKQALTGNGRATKDQVIYMVRQLLSIDESLQTDAADALATALCHSHASSDLLERNITNLSALHQKRGRLK